MNSYFSTTPFLSRSRRELGHKQRVGDNSRLNHSLSSALQVHHSWDPKKTVDHTDHGGVFNFDFSPDGSLLGVACERKSVLLFDPFNGKLVAHKLKAHTDCVNCVKFLDNRLFATCSDDTTVALWDARYLKHNIHVYHGHSNWVKNIEYAPNEGTLITSGFDGCIYTWNINRYAEDEEISSQVFYSSSLMRCKLSPDSSKLLISNYEGYIIVIHNLDLSMLKQDLAGFKPNNYRLMQQSQTPLRIGLMYNHVFERERNRVEFLSDWPVGNDANAISSLQIHPQGWCAVSRNIDSSEKGEWTCVHNIQDHEFKPRRQEHEHEISDITPHTSSSYCSSTNTPAFSSVAPSNRRNSTSPSLDNNPPPSSHNRQSPRQRSTESCNTQNENEPITELVNHAAACSRDDSDLPEATENVDGISGQDDNSLTTSHTVGASRDSQSSTTGNSVGSDSSNTARSNVQRTSTSEFVQHNSSSFNNSVDNVERAREDGERLSNSDNTLQNRQDNNDNTEGSAGAAAAGQLDDNVIPTGQASASTRRPLLDSSAAPVEVSTPGLGRTHDSLIQIRRGERRPDGHFTYSISVHTAGGRTIEFDNTDLESDDDDHNPIVHLLNPSGQVPNVDITQRPAGHRIPARPHSDINVDFISESEDDADIYELDHDENLISANEPLEDADSFDDNSEDGLDTGFRIARSRLHDSPVGTTEDGQPWDLNEQNPVEDENFINNEIPINETLNTDEARELVNSPSDAAVESDSDFETIPDTPEHVMDTEILITETLNTDEARDLVNSNSDPAVESDSDFELPIPDAHNVTSNNTQEGTNNSSQPRIPTRTNSFTFVLQSNAGERFLNLRYMDSFTESENVRLRDKIHTNSNRLLGYAEECNVGRGFIKELGFSSDGRFISSPFGFGLRLFGFNQNCDELCDCVPTSPVKLYEVTCSLAHGNYVVATKFSPTHNMVVSGCLDGKIVFHQPVL